MFENKLKELLNIKLSDIQLNQFENYFNFLTEFNQHTNLTRIVDKEEVYIKHFLDSCLLSRLIDFNNISTMCDMGSGAGFPSIPLLIIYPHLKVTIVESQIKRINFLKELVNILNVEVEIIHSRVEVYAKEHQETFDLVTARALGELRIILEYGIPILKVGGYFIAPKGSKYEEELLNSTKALVTLKSKVIKTDTFDLVGDMGFRANILIQKIKSTEGYPREYQKIIKKPL